MSNENLPEKINPFRFAESGSSLHGTLAIKDMQRLGTSLIAHDGEVQVHLQFEVDEQGTKILRGHLETQLKLQCQRCMQPFNYEIINDFVSGLVRSEEEAKQLPDVYEPVLVKEDGMLVIQDMIEDELIIGLPIVPMHDAMECKIELPKVILGSREVSEGDDNNPFKVIEILRAKRNSDRTPK